MSIIKILPDILSNKIAAGEVVERPASVVKELVENAIDANSSKITIEIEKGGRAMIRVSDNGQGMSHDDALLAIERYATSKTYNDADLYDIRTLGFRGEALPSISAVSKFTLTTKDQSSMVGTEVYIEAGKILKVSETGSPRGTMISVADLFFNIPARRKFLKSIETEMGHIADYAACMALAWPRIQFRLIHNHKIIKNWPPVGNPFDRIVDVVGHDIQPFLHGFNYQNPDIDLYGWASDPSVTRRTSQKIFIFVNGRHVRDRGIQYALFEGYKGRIMKGQFPVALIFLTLSPEQVDVNVHPTKHEVRFARQNLVYDAVRTALEQIWKTQRPISWKQGIAPESKVNDPFLPYPFLPEQTKIDMAKILKKNPEPDLFLQAQTSPEKFLGQAPDAFVRSEAQSSLTHMELGKTTSPQKISDCRVIGQYHNTYILCEQGDELVIIDQHAAHERIVYERLKRQQAKHGDRPMQRLIIPETIELSYREAAIIEQTLPDLNRLGLEIEVFGSHTFVIKSIPSLLVEREIKPLIIQIAEAMDANGYGPGFSEALDQCLILMACHAAIRAHQQLTTQEIRELLSQLDQCDNPYSCPHGRPTVDQWSLSQFEKSFKRTG